jgi:hypothetical protein
MNAQLVFSANPMFQRRVAIATLIAILLGGCSAEKNVCVQPIGRNRLVSPTLATNTYVTLRGSVELSSHIPGAFLVRSSEKRNGGRVTYGITRQPFRNLTSSEFTSLSGEIWLGGVRRIQAVVGRGEVTTTVFAQDRPQVCPSGEICVLEERHREWSRIIVEWERPRDASAFDLFELRISDSDTGELELVEQYEIRMALPPELVGPLNKGFEGPRAIDPEAENMYVLPQTRAFQANTYSGSRSVTAQLWVPLDGYRFQIESQMSTSYRLWIDGDWSSARRQWGIGPTPGTELVDRELKRGWHDVVLEAYSSNYGSAKLQYLTPSGPAEIPDDYLRPFYTNPDQISTGEDTRRIRLLRGTTATLSIPMGLQYLLTEPSHSIIADLRMYIYPQRWDDLRIQLKRPNLAEAIPVHFVGDDLRDGTGAIVHSTVELPADSLRGDWTLLIHNANTTGPDSAYVERVAMSARYDRQFASARTTQVAGEGEYQQVIDLEKVVHVTGVDVGIFAPEKTSIEVTAKSCEDRAGERCGPFYSFEKIEQVGLDARYLLLRAVFKNSNHQHPTLDGVSVTYETENTCEQ